MTRLFILTITSLAAGLAVALGAGAIAAGAETTGQRVVDLGRATAVREYAGWLLFSRWDGSAYRLSTWHDGQLRDLPVRPQAEPFDADVGPDSGGRPSAAVSLCEGTCDLYVLGFEAGDQLRPVRNANTNGHDETDPSVWKGRLVFAREYGSRVVPYTKRLQAPRSRPSDRLASLPDKRCGAVDPPRCRQIEKPELAQMELWGRWVAQSWRYQPDGFPGFRQNEVRLTDIARSETRQVAAMTTGLSGSSYLGPSIAEGRVAFFRACGGDRSGCSTDNFGALRYRISNGSYEIAPAIEDWSGWAWNGDAAFHGSSEVACDPRFGAATCGIYRQTGLDWRKITERRVR